MTPVTIVGGFLGAGKTTLVNHLLRTATRRYAVLVNDFGALSIDAALIEGAEAGLLSLANGCVCCSIGPDLGDTLARLQARDPSPDHMLIEASGVSDPWRIAQLVKLEPAFSLDAVLVLVDAAAFPGQLKDRYLTDTLERQLARADLIILNKCDLADPTPALAAINRIKPGARTVQVTNAALPEALIAGPASHNPTRFTADALDAEPDAEPTAEPPFRTWAWHSTTPFDPARLAAQLDSLPPSVLRLKGICPIGAAAHPHLLQLAGRRWSLTPANAATTGLILIGTPALPSPAILDQWFQPALLAACPLSPGRGSG